MKIQEQTQVGGVNVTIAQEGHTTVYTLEGNVDETFSFQKVPKYLGERTIFRLGGIGHFNSCGVREWVYLLREFSTVPHVVLMECSVSVMDQLNMINQAMGSATVASFFAPYYCPHCQEEEHCLLEVADHQQEIIDQVAPTMKHHCGHTMDFDALEDCYFEAIRSQLIHKLKRTA